MRNSTNVNPLITNFMVPKTPKTVSASNVKIIYDAQNQITLYMGGGGSPSRSNDGYKQTRERQSGSSYWTHNDAERYTDD